MPTVTGVLGMTLPESFDKVDVSVLSNNFSMIDNAFGQRVTLEQVANNLETTEEGKVLDARQGKVLVDSLVAVVTDVNTKVANINSASSGRAEALLARINTKARVTTHTVTIPSEEWVKNEDEVYQAVASVADVTADDSKTAVIVSPPSDRALEEVYIKYETRANTQGDGTVTFTCLEQPEEDISVNVMVIILGGEDTDLPELDIGSGGDAGNGDSGSGGTGDVVIGGSDVLGGSDTYFINISQLESGLYTADKTLDEVNTAYGQDKMLYCRRENGDETYVYVLVGVDANGYHFTRYTGTHFETAVLGVSGISIYTLEFTGGGDGTESDGNGGAFYADILASGENLTLNASSTELKAAYEANNIIYCRKESEDGKVLLLPLVTIEKGATTEEDVYVFSANTGELVASAKYENGIITFNESAFATEGNIDTLVDEAIQSAKENGELDGVESLTNEELEGILV